MIDTSIPATIWTRFPDGREVPLIWELEYRGNELHATTSVPTDGTTPSRSVTTRIDPDKLQKVDALPGYNSHYTFEGRIEIP